MALKIGEPLLLRWDPFADEWLMDKYSTMDWWITNVAEFEGCFYAATLNGKIAFIDITTPPSYGSFTLLETQSYKVGATISHVFDSISVGVLVSFHLVVRGSEMFYMLGRLFFQ